MDAFGGWKNPPQAGLYTRYLLPWLIDLAMRQRVLQPYRLQTVSAARGRVVEIGLGSGLNLPFYPPQVERLYGVEPSPPLLQRAARRASSLPFPVELLAQSGETLPLADASVDTVVTTWTLCTIAEIMATLQEMRRVLVPGGRLLFAEHGLAPDPSVATWQRRLTPLWQRLAGGCHLNRPIDAFIRTAGFTMTTLQTTYLPGPRPWTYFYCGIAVR
jgi:ubiquinone/menaquinone biosynthesis C-methylase UbiE